VIRRASFPCFIFLIFSQVLLAAGSDDLGAGMVNPGYEDKPAWFKGSFLDIREDLAEAVAENRLLMLYFYQDGCPYCAKLLQDNFGSSTIAAKTQKYFDTIAINLWGDKEVIGLNGEVLTEKLFGEQLKVQYTPTLIFLGSDGKVLMRLNGYFPPHKFSAVLDYLGGRKYTEKTFAQYYAGITPEAASGKLHVESFYLPTPLKLARKQRQSGRPLLVLFEQQQCKACDELHQDILRRTEIAAAISNFDVALVDVWSADKLQTPDGKTLTARDWAVQLNTQYTPSLVFFDASGKEVFRSEAYLRSFHLHALMDYVSTGAYRYQPNFQRFIQHRAEVMDALGLEVDLMN